MCSRNLLAKVGPPLQEEQWRNQPLQFLCAALADLQVFADFEHARGSKVIESTNIVAVQAA